MSVLERVVGKNWCVGCGMCAAVCPLSRLEMCWNSRGEYNPELIKSVPDCGESCLLCYDACPAHGSTKNETEIGRELYLSVAGIQHTPETGYWLSSYVGYSEKHRLTSASGGIATWVFESLLESGEVDAVAAVGRTSDSERLFEFRICETAEQIRGCSRSVYYPVEVSRVIQHMLDNEGHYAIIGLPCVCKAVRLVQDKFPKLKQRIKYVLGLTCGHTCSKFFAEYICALGGGDPYHLKEFIFRTKDLSQPASNLGMTFRTGEAGHVVSRQVLWMDGVNVAFTNGSFQLPGCFHCDDIFAECADAVFMDAWLPEYASQPEGHTIALVRNIQVNQLFVSGADQKLIRIVELPIQETIRSQKGVVERKRSRSIDSTKEPRQRFELFKHPSLMQRLQFPLLRSCGEVSANNWLAANKQLSVFCKRMKPLQSKIDFIKKINNFLLCRAVKKFTSFIKGVWI